MLVIVDMNMLNFEVESFVNDMLIPIICSIPQNQNLIYFVVYS